MRYCLLAWCYLFVCGVSACTSNSADKTDYELFQAEYEALVCAHLESCGEVCEIEWDLSQYLKPQCSEDDFISDHIEMCFDSIQSLIDAQDCIASTTLKVDAPICAGYVFPNECKTDPV